MNLLLRVSLTAALLSNVNTMIRSFATTAGNSESEEQAAEKKKMMNPSGDDFVTYNNTKVESELSRADWTRRRLKRLSPNKVTYMCLINSLCKHDFIEEAYWVLKKMIDSGFSPSLVTLNDVLRCFIRIGDMRNALEMRNEMRKNINFYGMDNATESSLYQGLLNEVTYTSLVTAYLDEGKWDNARALYYELEYLDQLLDDKPHCSHACAIF